MPTYEYRCNNCGHAFELFQSMSAPQKRKCPECAKNALERLIGTGAAVLFKGSGFYETDYRSEGYKKAAETEKKAGSGGEGAKSGDGASKGSSEAKKSGGGDSKSDSKSGGSSKRASGEASKK